MSVERRFVYCPDCQRKLFKVAFCDLEIKCKCGSLVIIRMYTESALMLTVDSTSDMIESVKQSNEGSDPDCETDMASKPLVS